MLYLIFFLLQTSLRSNAGKGKLDPLVWMWLVNLAYFAIALALNLWDTVADAQTACTPERSGLMFGVLDRYIGRTIFNTIMMTLFMLVSLSGIIKFVDQLRKVGQGEYSALGAGVYTLLSVPKDIEIFFPMGGAARGIARFGHPGYA
ncbi:Lipopolysaccharide export system permease protein lptG [Serratia fonticola]|uniref:Lipopolysaccharide export system permease protein lptG n=1 Tax=Serratia fonticola TaxID=47917 RepID=A0A4U9TW03_SERFO|nr:Lipopolysaccharide export system permease protein lptG [Serratia fonticola]